MKNAIIGTMAVGVLTLGVLYFLKQRAPQATASSAAGVTNTIKGGSTTISTTPIKPSAVAFVAPDSTLRETLSQGVSFLRTKLSSVLQHSGQNIMQPFGNMRSAEAAYKAPLRPEYKTQVFARDNIAHIEGYKARSSREYMA